MRGKCHPSGKKQPPKREAKREKRREEQAETKERVDKFAMARQKVMEKRAFEATLDEELMAATYGPSWRSILEKEMFPATPAEAPATEPAKEPDEEDLDAA